MTVLDLSHPLMTGMPVYPGAEPPVFEQTSGIESDGFAEKRITLFSHTGTHMDAPSHILSGADGLDRMKIDRFMGNAVCVDVSAVQDSSIGVVDLEPAAGLIDHADFLMLCTGWSRFWGRPAYFESYPVLTTAAARWLQRFNLKGLGVDAISVDRIDSTRLPVHNTLLAKGMVIVENLAGLERLPAKLFTFLCFPLAITDADGSPVRAVAVTDHEIGCLEP